MELRQLKARLALLDTMIGKMNGSAVRVQHIRRTLFVLRSMLNLENGIPSVYGPQLSIAQFSLQ
jgi:hypothetical protein